MELPSSGHAARALLRSLAATFVALAACCVALVVSVIAPVSTAAGATIPTLKDHLTIVQRVARHETTRPGLPTSWTAIVKKRAHCSRATAISDGPCTISGTVVDPLTDLPLAGAAVEWGYYPTISADWVFGNTTTTDTNGHFSFSGVRATVHGTIDVYRADGGGTLSFEDQEFGATAGDPLALEASARPVFIAQSTKAAAPFWVDVYGEGGATRTRLPAVDTYDSPIQVDTATIGTPTSAVVYLHENEAAEGVVQPGYAIDCQTQNPASMWIDRPFWGSGPPGSVVRITGRLPLVGALSGRSEDPAVTSDDLYTGAVMGSASYYVKIPAHATPGYYYDLRLTRLGDWFVPFTSRSALELVYPFQVSTLKPSRASIARGGSVTLAGVIPTQGHVGATAGAPKTLVLYSADKPHPISRWTPRGDLWAKVATIKADGLGRFRSKALHPKSSTWYVVRYPGDDWYWGAFTAPTLVKVR